MPREEGGGRVRFGVGQPRFGGVDHPTRYPSAKVSGTVSHPRLFGKSPRKHPGPGGKFPLCREISKRGEEREFFDLIRLAQLNHAKRLWDSVSGVGWNKGKRAVGGTQINADKMLLHGGLGRFVVSISVR